MAVTLTIDLAIAVPVQIASTTSNCKQPGLFILVASGRVMVVQLFFACFSQCAHVHESRYTHGVKASKEEKRF